MVDSGVNQFVARMAGSFIPEKAAGMDATIQLNLSGDHAGNWYLAIKDQKFNINEGVAPHPSLTVSANSADLLQIFSGQMDAMQAFMQGKVRLTGDMNLAMKLTSFFKMG